ncbi:monovalent cation/H+ antiporter subunit D [Acinetobacter sp. c3-l95]|uniref:monovalent cation/H+ antiporter subunit D n=1 Tax=Acinetobacter sp. c3-l95 TaxID=3342804 RepID=UPI0035BB8186
MLDALVSFWQVHFPIFSILLPAFTSFILILLGNPGAGSLQQDWRQPIRHAISLISASIGLIFAILMVMHASTGATKVYELAQWTAPFGIVLVVDRLAAMMVLLSYILVLPILWYASAEWDLKGRYFHTMMHFLMMGISGAFLTGDLFNLFVFFEILLMSSYVLLLHSHSTPRFKMGIHYVIINLLASALFLIGLGLIYGNVGSLNMADVARLYPTLPEDNHQMALAGALLLFVVFGIKAAMFPVGFWLPKTYAVATTPVAAIFALMTKVGIYAILRVNGTVFSDAGSNYVLDTLLLGIGVATTIYGVIGAMGAERLRRMIGFMVLSSIGTILIAVALNNTQAWSAALYYLVHSTFVAAAFYLLAEWIGYQRGDAKDHIKIAPIMKQNKLVSILFFILALMMAGLPPLSGFVGKVMILQATAYSPYQVWIILAILLVSLLSILVFVRTGFLIFWRAEHPEDNPKNPAFTSYQALPSQPTPRVDKLIYLFIGLLISYAVVAEPVHQYAYAAAAQLQDKSLYQRKVLKFDENNQPISVQKYDANYLPGLKYGATSDDPYQHTIKKTIHPDTLYGDHIDLDKLSQSAEPQSSQQPLTQPASGAVAVNNP